MAAMEPPARPQPISTPEIKVPFELAEGFEINLFAASPSITKPVHMNFDARGRLWVVTSSIYPQVEPGDETRDEVVILEDVNGNGRADQASYFAWYWPGLRIPTGVIPGDGGCYVAHGAQLLFFADTNNDGRADDRRVVLSGFGTEDTHHLLHTLRWGPDGCLYLNQSIYINSHIETPHGVVRLARGGVFRFDTRTHRLDVLARGWNNPWGHAFDEYGNSFVTDASYDGGPFDAFPGAVYWDYAAGRKTVPIDRPRQPQFAGAEFVRSRHFPEDMQGELLCTAFKGNRVIRYAIREQGSTFAIEAKGDLVRSSDVTFRPVDVKQGPDGAIYIADWANPIINHGEVDFRDPRRDKKLGRIWRVTAKGRALAKTPDLTTLSNEALLDHLASPEGFARDQARRVLAERGAAILPALDVWAKAQTDDRLRLEAAWLYRAVGAHGRAPLRELLAAPDPRVRAAAVRMIGDDVGATRRVAPTEILAPRVADDHPRVRLEAVRALGRIPDAHAAALALTVLDRPMDPTLDFALSATMNELADPWLAALESGAWTWEGREAQLDFALGALPPDRGLRALRFVLKGREIPRDGSGPLIGLIARAGGPEELRLLLDRFLAGGFETGAHARILDTLAEAMRIRGVKPSGDLDAAAAAMQKHAGAQHAAPLPETAAVLSALYRVFGRWKIASQTPALLAGTGSPAMAPDVRRAAFEALREIGGRAAIDGVRALCAAGRPYDIRRPAALALAVLDPKGAPPDIAAVLRDAPDEDAALALWRELLTLKDYPAPLVPALRESRLPAHAARAGLRALRERDLKPPDLVAALSESAGPGAAGAELADQEVRDLAARAVREGNPARGEAVFLRKVLKCLDCHAVSGVGAKVGPDLGALGAASPPDYILESLLYPSRKIKEGFHAVTVTTVDERIFTGRPSRETDDELVLLTSDGKEESIPKRDISERRPVPQSIMPSGLLDALPPGDLLDLTRFLTELGRPGPYDRYRPPENK
jgi:putative heme-binding domain-containing protein